MNIRRVLKKPKMPNFPGLPYVANFKNLRKLPPIPKRKELTDGLQKSMLVLKNGLSQEKDETKKMLLTYRKFTTGEATEAEMQEANEQFVDVLRSLGLSIVVILPFSPVTLPALVKLGDKLGIDILPSAFREEPSASIEPTATGDIASTTPQIEAIEGEYIPADKSNKY